MFSVMVMTPVAAICNKVAALSIWELFLNICHITFKEPSWVLVRLFSFFFSFWLVLIFFSHTQFLNLFNKTEEPFLISFYQIVSSSA